MNMMQLCWTIGPLTLHSQEIELQQIHLHSLMTNFRHVMLQLPPMPLFSITSPSMISLPINTQPHSPHTPVQPHHSFPPCSPHLLLLPQIPVLLQILKIAKIENRSQILPNMYPLLVFLTTHFVLACMFLVRKLVDAGFLPFVAKKYWAYQCHN